MEPTLRTVHLYGELAELCQPSVRLAVHTPAEAVRALITNFPKSDLYIRDGEFCLVRGKTLKDGWNFDKEFLHFGLGSEDLHIIPTASGAAGAQQRKGAMKTILGAALIAGAVIASQGTAAGLATAVAEQGLFASVTYGNIALFGAALVFGGISYLLAPTPDKSSSDEDQAVSHLYKGPINTTQQGNPVPVVYGQMRVGSQVISVGIENSSPQGTGSTNSPDRLAAKLEESNGPVVLSWKAFPGALAYEYRYRRKGTTTWGDWNSLLSNATLINVSGHNFRSGYKYEFQVRAAFSFIGGEFTNFGPPSSYVTLEYGRVGSDSDSNDEDEHYG